MEKLSHIDEKGKAKMVDISEKKETARIAIARCWIRLKPETIQLIRENKIAKGEVLGTARIAGISAGKRTFELIPLCHNIPIDQIQIDCEFVPEGIEITAQVKTTAKTGAEMEALASCAISALTIYDMVKAVDRSAEIKDLRLEYKAGGKSGEWRRDEQASE